MVSAKILLSNEPVIVPFFTSEVRSIVLEITLVNYYNQNLPKSNKSSKVLSKTSPNFQNYLNRWRKIQQ